VALVDALPPALLRRAALGPLRWLWHRRHGRLAELDDAARLMRQYRGVLADNVARLVRAGQMIDAAADAGVTLMPFKGVLLADAVYGDPGARPMADIDLMVRAAELPAAERALLRLGFRRLFADGPRYRPPFAHDVALTDGRFVVELHFRWLHDLGVHAEVEPLFDRAIEIEALGRRRRVPAWDDHLLIAAVHAADHAFAHTTWLLDVALLADRAGGFAGAAARAQACAAERAFATAVALATQALATRLPPPVLPPRGAGRARWLAPLLARTWAAPPARAATLAAKLLMTDSAAAAVEMLTSRAAVVVAEQRQRLRRRS
jgi:hypothetical protein